VEAFESIETDNKLVIAGEGAYESAYVEGLLSHRSERVFFPGFVSGRLLDELYAHCSLYVQPSLLEGVSVAVLEVLSHGCRVLASDIAANREALGPCGHTFEAGNPQDLREKLLWLLSDKDEAESRVEFHRAREYIGRDRSWERTTQMYEDLYFRLIEQFDSRGTAVAGQMSTGQAGRAQ